MRHFRSCGRIPLFLLALATLGFMVSCQNSGESEASAPQATQASMMAKPAAAPSHDEMVARGKYLVTIAACHDCHTPKKDLATQALDETRLLSGRPATTMAPHQPHPGEVAGSGDLTAWWGPWGVSYAANLTPDPETGLGKRYNEASFIKTIRTGKKPEGEPLLPPMPWAVYANMTDDDLKAVYAYLSSLPPVKNFVRATEPKKGP